MGVEIADDFAGHHWRDRDEPPPDPSEGLPPPPNPDDEIEAALDAAHAHAIEVERETYRLRVREAARDKLAAEKATAIDLPGVRSLADFLAEPDPELTHRVAGLWPTGGRIVLAAPPKTGKTTLTGNLLRSLVDGQPFLDTFEVQPATRVLLLDNELDARMLRRWLRDQGIDNRHAVELVPLRGRLSSFNILDPTTRTRWAEHLGAADVLILDCLRPALDALALSEDKDAGRFLEALDELTTEAGIPETLTVHHMGHSGERSRGDSRILDWPDASWKLVKDAEDEDQIRRVYFTAGPGRDVDHPETLLAYDADTRHLSIAGGSRKEARTEALAVQVLEYVEQNPGCTQTAIERAIEGKAAHIRTALRQAVTDGLVIREPGRHNSFLHTRAHARTSVRPARPSASGRGAEYRVPASIEDADADAPTGLDGAKQQRDADAKTNADDDVRST